MLVLTRKVGEGIRIDQTIEVSVLKIHRGRVKLGFSCSDDIPVHREEVQQQIDSLAAGSCGRPISSCTHDGGRADDRP